MASKKTKLKPYLYNDDAYSNFAMVSSDLFASWQFQDLSHAARSFYLLCAVHKHTGEQSTCLFKALKEYYELKGEEISEYDLKLYSGQIANAKVQSMYFVIPQSHLGQYGYTAQYANKLKKELIDKGFIKVFANEKKHAKGNVQGANRDFSKRVTIYEFSTDWKRREV